MPPIVRCEITFNQVMDTGVTPMFSSIELLADDVPCSLYTLGWASNTTLYVECAISPSPVTLRFHLKVMDSGLKSPGGMPVRPFCTGYLPKTL